MAGQLGGEAGGGSAGAPGLSGPWDAGETLRYKKGMASVRLRLSVSLSVSSWLVVATPAARAMPPEVITPTVLSARPHDPGAFTQGLRFHDGSLYESTGRYGMSTLRQVDPQSGEVSRSVDIGSAYFGEGLALVPNIHGGDGYHLILLTWREEVAFVYELDTFARVDAFSYTGEGWGLCFDSERLVMSNGTSRLTFRDPSTFESLGSVEVTQDGVPRHRLNELECVGDVVYANVWQTDEILRIDATTGEVTAEIDCAGLLTPEAAAAAEVLNGIAFVPEEGRFLITGKLWPVLFEVDLAPEPGGEGPVDPAAGEPGGCQTSPTAPNLTLILLLLGGSGYRRRRSRTIPCSTPVSLAMISDYRDDPCP